MANEKRLIDANDLWQKTFICDEVAEVRKFIEQAPTVDAVEVVHGHWVIKTIKNSEYKYCYCSECLSTGSPRWKVCPLCETKMVGERKDNA